MTVQTLRARLTRDDIQRLSSATDSEGRALAARKFCARFASVDLSDDERARDPLTLLAEHPTLMKRPLIDAGGTLHLGWGKDTQHALLG